MDFVRALFKVTDLSQHFITVDAINKDTDKFKKENVLQIVLIFSDVSGCVRNELYSEIIHEKLSEVILKYHDGLPDLKEKMLKSLKNQSEFVRMFVRPLIIYLSEIITIDDVISTNLI